MTCGSVAALFSSSILTSCRCCCRDSVWTSLQAGIEAHFAAIEHTVVKDCHVPALKHSIVLFDIELAMRPLSGKTTAETCSFQLNDTRQVASESGQHRMVTFCPAKIISGMQLGYLRRSKRT